MFKPSSLTLAATALCTVAQAQSQAAPGSYAVLPSVVVTATRTDSRVDALAADVTVLTRADLDKAAGHTLAQLLSDQPGVQSSADGGMGQSDAIYMRGLESRHTLLLIDGMRVGAATTGQPTWSSLPLSDIERIEIVRGPLGGLYGSDAVAGVVQVFTRQPRSGSAANASVGAGRYGHLQTTAGWSGGEGPWSLAVQGGHEEASGFSATNSRNFSYNPDNDGFSRDFGSVQAGVRLGGDWRAQARAFSVESTNDYDDGSGASASFRTRNQVLGTDVRGSLLPGWRTKVAVARSSDAYDTLSVSSPFSEIGKISTVQRQYSWENSIDTPVGTALVLAEHLYQGVDKPGGFTVSERRINAVGLGLSGEAGAHLWQLSGRGDDNSQFGRQKTGSLGYGWHFLPGWTVGGQYGTAFVAPSFNDLYWPLDAYGNFGNPNLRPSRSHSSEVSLGYRQGDVEAKVTRYRTRVADLIQWVDVGTSPAASAYTPMNVARAAVDGMTMQGQLPLAGLLWKAGVDLLDARDQDTGKELARRARRVARLAADGQLGDWRYGAAVAGYSGRWSDANNLRRLSGYALLDLRVDWQFHREWTLGARLNNALDRQYETSYGYNQPGRALMVTLRYQGS